MEQAIRKVVFQEGSYQLLKPKENGKWHKYGKRKSLKAIYDIMMLRKCQLIITEDVVGSLEGYIKKKERGRKHREKGLTKLI